MLFSFFRRVIRVGVIALAAPWAYGDAGSPSLVGTLVSRQHVVEIFTTSEGPRYTIKNHADEILAAHLSESDVLSQFPEVGPIIKGIADDASLSPYTPKTFDPHHKGS